MSQYFANVIWKKQAKDNFIEQTYSRGHLWQFDGGAVVNASSSPHIVPLPYSVEANVDPEEAFVASISSCHMLFFLSIAAKKRFIVESYIDNAVGIMDKDEEGRLAMTEVILKPQVLFSGDKQATKPQLEKIHHLAHQQCFIANSIKTKVTTQVIL